MKKRIIQNMLNWISYPIVTALWFGLGWASTYGRTTLYKWYPEDAAYAWNKPYQRNQVEELRIQYEKTLGRCAFYERESHMYKEAAGKWKMMADQRQDIINHTRRLTLIHWKTKQHET